MRFLICAAAMLALLACAPEIPESGIGFNDSPDARRARELELTGATPGTLDLPPVVSDERVPASTPLPAAPPVRVAGTSTSASSADIAAEAAAALAASSANSGVAPVQASPTNATPVTLNNPGISTENDFAAVSSERSISGDADRIARNKQQYQVIQPTALPTRTGNSDPNIVKYALSTTHARGTRLYSRTGINLAARAQRNCAKYASPDQAQMEFLAKGGPERDRNGLDPDGDGFACAWNPAPFRTAVKN